MEKPLYEKIYNQLKNDITNGKFKKGEKLPSEKELSEYWNVSRITPKKSLEMLVNEGLVIRQAGRGSFVADNPQELTNLTDKIIQKPPRLIGFIAPNLEDSYGVDIFKSIESEASKHNCLVIVKRSLGNYQKEKEAIKELLEANVSGIIMMPIHAEHFNEEILKLVVNNFPIVLVDRYLKGVPAISFSSDNHIAAKKATEYLFELGHTNVSLLSPPYIDTSALEERYEGFIEAHVQNNIKIDKNQLLKDLSNPWTNSFKNEDIERDISNIINHLQENPQITALLAVEYRIALLAEVALKKMGKRIPEDISIVCFDRNVAEIDKYKFTHIKQEQYQMGKLAFQSILKMLGNETLEKKNTKLETTLVEGKSTSKREISERI